MLINIVKVNEYQLSETLWVEFSNSCNAGEAAAKLAKVFNLKSFLVAACEFISQRLDSTDDLQTGAIDSLNEVVLGASEALKLWQETSERSKPEALKLGELEAAKQKLMSVVDSTLSMKTEEFCLSELSKISEGLSFDGLLDNESTTIWWISKPFEASEALSKRVGKNEKTKIKVQLRDKSWSDSLASPKGSLIADAFGSKYYAAFLVKEKERRKQLQTDQKRKSSNSEASETGEGESEVNKRTKLQESEFSEEWSIKPDVLNKLGQSEDIRSALKDQRLQDLIRSIDSAPNRSKELQLIMDANPDFSSFVDKCLGTIGATKVDPVTLSMEFDSSNVLLLKKPET